MSLEVVVRALHGHCASCMISLMKSTRYYVNQYLEHPHISESSVRDAKVLYLKENFSDSCLGPFTGGLSTIASPCTIDTRWTSNARLTAGSMAGPAGSAEPTHATANRYVFQSHNNCADSATDGSVTKTSSCVVNSQ